MFKWLAKLFKTDVEPIYVRPKKQVFVSFRNGYLTLDVNGYLKSPQGKKCLEDAKCLTDKLIAEGKIIDLTTKHNSA